MKKWLWAALLMPVAAAALAQERRAVLEEVIVTAQLREQSLQDVPVSVSAISGEKLLSAGLNKIEDLQAYIPNLTMTENGIGTSIYIRGIGSGINQGFEQSVGMYVDGIYYGRAQLARAPFLDLERVEVLRGPQNILYGKNSIAGAISIVTSRPSEEFEGAVSATYEPRFEEEVLDLILSGPISDTLGYRFSARLRNYGGFMENLTLDRDEPAFDEATYRLKLRWDASDAVTVSVKGELGSFDVTGRQAEIINDSPSVSTNPLFAGRTHGQILNETRDPTGLVLDIDSDSSVLNNFQDFKRSSNGDFSLNNTENLTINADWIRGDHTFTSITGYMAYDYDDLCDCDFTGAEGFKVSLVEDYQQISQELRWISPAGENFEFIGGFYYQKSELEFFDSIIVDSDLIVQLLNAADATEGGARGDNDPNPLGGSPEEIAGIGDAGNAIANLTSPRTFTSDSELYSVFLQSTWNATDTIRVTLGGRYSMESKEGSRHFEFGDLNYNVRPFSETDTVAAVSFAAERHNLKGSRDESQFSPLLNLQWDATDDMMIYTTLSRGYKSGGFDARSNASPSAEPVPLPPGAAPNPARPEGRPVLIGTFEYEEEEATSLEIGFKSTLLDGAAELNAALFRTEFDNLQVSIFDGTLGFNVGNAASATTQGLELDGRIQLSEYLMLAGALAFLDFEFDDFQNGQCLAGQEPTAPDGINCDYTGKTNQYVADFAGNLVLTYIRPISPEVGIGLSLDAIFTDDYNPAQNLDPAVQQDGYVKFNGRAGIAALDRTWELALVGKNLTDEVIVMYASDTPTAFTIFGNKGHYGFLEAPRSVALQFSYRW
ncbi:TonB-dependent receptor [Litorivivens sp.]|uniref:TonB-dependent receptor n=1 Tax=Litorivivens sp. TaxID=2020868 RepID=UPI00356357A8